MEIIRPGTPDDLLQVREVWNACFGADAFADWFFQNLYKAEYLRVLTLDDRVVSIAFCFPRKIQTEQQGTLSAWYLYGVGTLPAARGKSCAKRLVCACAEEARCGGVDLCFLIPAEQSLFLYYEKIGFSRVWTRTVGETVELKSVGNIRLQPVVSDDFDCLNALYETSFHAFVKRSHLDWKNILGDFRLGNGEIYRIFSAENEIGYCCVLRQEDEIRIRELCTVQGVDQMQICHAICAALGVKKWSRSDLGEKVPFAAVMQLSEKVLPNLVYCDLLYN